MFRRKSLAIAAAGLLAVIALVAGCTSAPLTDSRQILTKAQANLASLQSVHFHLEAGGQFIIGVQPAPTPTPTPEATASPSASPSPTPTASPTPAASGSAGTSAGAKASASQSPTPTPTPTPSPSPSPESSASPTPTPTPVYTALPVSLTGAVADGDIDFANKRAHVIGGAPNIPGGISGELIVIDPYAYYRGYGQTVYQLDSDSNLAFNPALSSGPIYVVTQLVAVANDTGSSPVLVGTEQEPSGAAYHIRVSVTQNALNSNLQSLQVVQALGSGQLDLWITQDSLQLERMEFSTADPAAGAAAVRIQLSNWNNVPFIQGPPPEQFNLPSETPIASY